MTAFVAFVKSYAVLLYLLCVLGVLFALKMIGDARRMARTTLFSLDQEHAGEQTYRAAMIILVSLAGIGAITAVLAFVAPVIPTAQSPIVRAPTSTLVFIFPSNTPLPTYTPTLRPSETAAVVSSDTRGPSTPSPIATRPTSTSGQATLPPAPRTPTVPPLPAPALLSPKNGDVKTGENQMNTSLIFKWSWNCPQCRLGPQDRFELIVTYVDKRTGAGAVVVGNSPVNTYLSMGAIIGGGSAEVYQKAKDDTFYWFVQVKRGDLALTPPSQRWKFVWH